MLALPAPKTLWEARSRPSWQEKFELRSNYFWTFGDLIDAHKQPYELTSAQRLNSWNAGTDNLGSLLNIATGMMYKGD